jgi:hypothetical protein
MSLYTRVDLTAKRFRDELHRAIQKPDVKLICSAIRHSSIQLLKLARKSIGLRKPNRGLWVKDVAPMQVVGAPLHGARPIRACVVP